MKNSGGTIYDPVDTLPDWLKRYRAMTEKEYKIYSAKIAKEEGFDVDGCPGTLPGRIAGINPATFEWELAEFAAMYSAEVNSIEYKQLVKANLQPVGGSMYYLTFAGVDKSDNEEKVYRSKVWAKPGPSLEVLFCKAFFTDSRIALEMRQKIADILSNIPQTRSKAPVQLQQDNESVKTISFNPSKQELHSTAYRLLVKEFQSHNPTWTHSKARTKASGTWKSMGQLEKQPYVEKAWMKLLNVLMEEHGHPSFGEEFPPGLWKGAAGTSTSQMQT